MGALPGLKLNLTRMIGMIINYITMILVVAVYIPLQLNTHQQPLYLMAIPIALAVGLIFFLKSEIDAIDEHRPAILASLIIILGAIQTVLLFMVLPNALSDYLLYHLPILIAVVSIVVVCHYTLSIYKNEKVRYYVGVMAFNGLWLLSGPVVLGLWAIVPNILSVISFFMVLIAEQMMVKKKLLNFI
jgi:hypothetical protein